MKAKRKPGRPRQPESSAVWVRKADMTAMSALAAKISGKRFSDVELISEALRFYVMLFSRRQ